MRLSSEMYSYGCGYLRFNWNYGKCFLGGHSDGLQVGADYGQGLSSHPLGLFTWPREQLAAWLLTFLRTHDPRDQGKSPTPSVALTQSHTSSRSLRSLGPTGTSQTVWVEPHNHVNISRGGRFGRYKGCWLRQIIRGL